MRRFGVSELNYSSVEPYAVVDVVLTFTCSRPLYEGEASLYSSLSL